MAKKPLHRRVFVRSTSEGFDHALAILPSFGSIVSLHPPEPFRHQNYWRFEMESEHWPAGPYGEAILTLSQTKASETEITITYSIQLPV